MDTYRVLNKQFFRQGNYSIVPIRFEDRYAIMKWRNEQMYHLRQNNPLTIKEQDNYFKMIVTGLFDQQQPNQILFSYLEGDKCIGYGGLVHINWIDQNAEISFIMDTSLEKEFFEFHWLHFLKLIEKIAFGELELHKIFTYAFDLRPKLYNALEKEKFVKEAVLTSHGFYNDKYYDIVIHSKIYNSLLIRDAKSFDAELTYKWATSPDVRKYSFDKTPIIWATHKNWFTNKINDINCEYYILMNNGRCIGSLRFDIDNENNAMISYLIDPMFHGQGYGKIILEKGIERLKGKHKNLLKVTGLVQKENIPSLKIFEKLNFQNVSTELSNCKFEKIISK